MTDHGRADEPARGRKPPHDNDARRQPCTIPQRKDQKAGDGKKGDRCEDRHPRVHDLQADAVATSATDSRQHKQGERNRDSQPTEKRHGAGLKDDKARGIGREEHDWKRCH